MTHTIQKWKEAEEAKLIELFNLGLTNNEICEQLGRSKDSVAHRISLLKQNRELNGKRRTKTSKQVYNSTAMRIIENFKNRKLKTKHKIGNGTLDISNENHDLILNMDKRNEADGLAANSRSNYIIHLRSFALRLGQKSLLKATRDSEIMPYMTELQKRLKPSAYNPHKSTLKFFYNKMYQENPDNKELGVIAAYLNQKKRSRTQAEEAEEKEHCSKQEIVKLVSAIKGNDKRSIRDRAIIACLYDSGARLSEFVAVSKKDTVHDAKVPYLHLPISKTKPRNSHMLNFSMPYLEAWVKAHEFWNGDNPPLFYSMSTANYGDPIAQQMITLILRRALRLSKIGKRITPHSLRHSKAYHMALEGMLPSEANARFGWGRSSAMFNYYTRLNDREMKLRELERAGKLTKEQLEERKQERNAFVSTSCKRCHTKILPDQFVCPKCGLAKNKQIAEVELKNQKESQDRLDAMERKLDSLPESIAMIVKLYKEGQLTEAGLKQALAIKS